VKPTFVAAFFFVITYSLLSMLEWYHKLWLILLISKFKPYQGCGKLLVWDFTILHKVAECHFCSSSFTCQAYPDRNNKWPGETHKKQVNNILGIVWLWNDKFHVDLFRRRNRLVTLTKFHCRRDVICNMPWRSFWDCKWRLGKAGKPPTRLYGRIMHKTSILIYL
jgi:hypothetical protein